MGDDQREGEASIARDGEAGAHKRAWLASTTRLNESSAYLTASSDLASILYDILDATIELQGADFGNVQLYDEPTQTLKIVAHHGLVQGFLEYFATVDCRRNVGLRPRAALGDSRHYRGCEYPSGVRASPRHRRRYRISRRAIDAFD